MIGSVVAAAGGLTFFAIGIRALFAPGISSVQYGLPTTDPVALALVRAVGARDLVLGIVVLCLLATRNRDGVALVLGVSVLAALADATAVRASRRNASLRHIGVHVGGAAALFTAWMLVRRDR